MLAALIAGTVVVLLARHADPDAARRRADRRNRADLRRALGRRA